MSTIPFRRNPEPLPTRITTDLAEQFRKTYGLTGEPEDQVIVELIGEIDNQASLYNGGGTPSIRSQISNRRADMLVQVSRLMSERQNRRDSLSINRITGNVFKFIKDVMVESHLDVTQINDILRKAADRIEMGFSN